MKKKKIVLVIVIILCLILLLNLRVYASSIDTNININNAKAGEFDNMGSIFISTIRIIGMIVSVGALMVIGIRYMTSSLEERAMEKESMIFYCIGAVLVFAIVNIVSAIYEWISTI